KAAVVVADEREQNLRALLNLGHTIGHAIEAVAGYGRLRHGEAVAIGMAAAAQMAEHLDLITAPQRREVEENLALLGLPTRLPPVPGKDAVADIMARSEEHTSELQSRENLVCRLLLEKKKNM